MSYPPDPNNPYGQPPAAPGYGYPQQAPPPAAAYGYPQAAPAYGYAPVAPPSMPGLVMTARVLLFVIGGVQIIITGILLIAAAGTKTVANQHSTDSDTAIFGNAAAGILLVFGIVYLLASVLSITLGVKFGKGGPATRITTIVYASVFLLLGLLVTVSAITGAGQTQGTAAGSGFGVVVGLLWIAICVLWIVAMATRDGVNWFNRPRY
ncbi:hypothetical protein ACFU7Y_42905 [Kitasatospora sp. NPDC057542]|uniref:hypothetical protein n=1 Tax=Streptomycetaceae TaxID=2062 RepID=UPI001CCCDADE|nr:hypothetical protein [Streptomyces sp. LS1784]